MTRVGFCASCEHEIEMDDGSDVLPEHSRLGEQEDRDEEPWERCSGSARLLSADLIGETSDEED